MPRFYLAGINADFEAAWSGLDRGQNFFVHLPAGEPDVTCFPAPNFNLSRFLRKSDEQPDVFEDQDTTLVEVELIRGIHPDGEAWQGAKVPVSGLKKKNMQFQIETSKYGCKTVSEFVKWFERRSRKKAWVAFNCGCLIQPDVVEKLGLHERFVGSPGGLMVKNGEVLGVPLYNRPALLVYFDGTYELKRVNTNMGLTISCRSRTVEFPPNSRNIDPVKQPLPDFCYYDLLYEKDEIPGDGRVVVRFAGKTIKEIIFTRPGENVPVKPVGLTLSIADEAFPATWDMVDKDLDIMIHGLEDVVYAFEAGPLLIDHGKVAVDLLTDGILSGNFGLAYPATVQKLQLRDRRLALAIDSSQHLWVFYLDGMIRESVGASYHELAEILVDHGMEKAFCIEPADIATLVVDGKVLSNSVFNPDFRNYPIALPPVEHVVAGAFIASI